METTHKCEVCGLVFNDFAKGTAHEKVCKETHATGLRIERELLNLLAQADAAKVKITYNGNTHGDTCFIADAAYDARTKQVHIELRVDLI